MEYKSNTSEVIRSINMKLLPLKFLAPLQKEVATTIRASISRRVFNDGQAVNGNIGQYSTNPIYVSPLNSPKKFSTKGKNSNSKSTFKNGKPRKTKYFSAGYKGFRSHIGRDTTKVNLTLSGRLFRSWVVGQYGSDWVVGFNSTYGSEVAAGNEGHFGKKIFAMSRSDWSVVGKIVYKYMQKGKKNA